MDSLLLASSKMKLFRDILFLKYKMFQNAGFLKRQIHLRIPVSFFFSQIMESIDSKTASTVLLCGIRQNIPPGFDLLIEIYCPVYWTVWNGNRRW